MSNSSTMIGVLSAEDCRRICELVPISFTKLKERTKKLSDINDGFKLDQLKVILKYLKSKDPRITMSGNKSEISEKICSIIHGYPYKPTSNDRSQDSFLSHRGYMTFNNDNNNTRVIERPPINSQQVQPMNLIHPATFTFPSNLQSAISSAVPPPAVTPTHKLVARPTIVVPPPTHTGIPQHLIQQQQNMQLQLQYQQQQQIQQQNRRPTVQQNNKIDWLAFSEKQSILFESVKIISHYPITKGTTGYHDFMIDSDLYSKITSKEADRFYVHLRLMQNSSILSYSHDMKLSINDNVITLPYKLRTQGILNAHIIPKPLDISSNLRKDRNKIILSAPQRYEGALVIQVVRNVPFENIIAKITKKESPDFKTIISMKKKDNDIEELSYDVSIKCPLSFTRISCPVRTKFCTHLQCFDLQFYLQYSFQQQIWNCPICSGMGAADYLVYDKHTADILKEIPSDTTSFTVQPDGTWSFKNDLVKKEKLKEEPQEETNKQQITEIIGSQPTNEEGQNKDDSDEAVYDVDSMLTPTPPINTDVSDNDFDFDFNEDEENEDDDDEDENSSIPLISSTTTSPESTTIVTVNNNNNNNNNSNNNNTSNNNTNNNSTTTTNNSDDDCIIISDGD